MEQLLKQINSDDKTVKVDAEQPHEKIKLVFYVRAGIFQTTKVKIYEREAEVYLTDKNNKPIKYKFDMIEGAGRPFVYVSAEAIGEVVEDTYHTLLVLEERDDCLAKTLWDKFYLKKKFELEQKLDDLNKEHIALIATFHTEESEKGSTNKD